MNMDNLYIKQIPIGSMMNYSYFIGLKDKQEIAVIDVSWDANILIKLAKKENKKITAIILTHTHYDHCNAVDDFIKILPIPVYVHENEKNELSQGLNIKTTKDGSIIDIGELKITCIHTPGHTPGSQCFLVENTIFTGDTLFVDSCGRVDLPGSNPSQMSSSLKKLARLDDNIIVYPGHNYGDAAFSTIGQQKKTNYYMVNGIG